MRNFDKKVQHLNRLFMYKFSVYDKKNQKLKIYYISPDKSHIYLMVDNIIGVNGYLCEIGQLYFSEKNNSVFEDTPNESFYLDKESNKIFKLYYNSQPIWSDSKIIEISNLFNTGVWFFEN